MLFWVQYRIWYEKNADDILLALVIVRKSKTVQLACLASVQAHQKLGGSMAGATDPNWPVECSTSYNNILSG